MQALLQPVILRLLAYITTPLMALVPLAMAGLVSYDAPAQMVHIQLSVLVLAITTGFLANGGIAAKWGFLAVLGNPSALILRLAVYALTPLIAMVPVSYAAFITLNPTTGDIAISLNGIAGVGAASLVFAGAVFAKWGVRPLPPNKPL